MSIFKRFTVRSYEIGLVFREGEFLGLLHAGSHWFFDPLKRLTVEVVSQRTPQFVHDKLDIIVKSGALKGYALVVDLKDDERGLVWVDDRFNGMVPGGLYVFWTGVRQVRVEIVNARKVRFEHEELQRIARWSTSNPWLDVRTVKCGYAAVLFMNGTYVDTLEPGLYAFWRGAADLHVYDVDLRETTIDVGGQEIMTLDKVTLRINAVVTFRVANARRAVSVTDDVKQALYREAQLVLRAVVGVRDLDALLGDKEIVARETEDLLRRRAEELGVTILSTGIRDVILPGDMKELMNKVTEAKKAAEANLVTRREETAAYRSQANTAKLLADNPVLMRLRELEALEKIAGTGHLKVVLGEKGLAERVVNLL